MCKFRLINIAKTTTSLF